MAFIRLFIFFNLITLSLQAKHLHKEKVYQEHFCKAFGGITEYRLEDRTRVDCLLNSYAIEVDFAQKWAESIGQSLYYASMTARKAAVLLIIEDAQRDQRYLERLKNVSRQHNIDIWTIDKTFSIQKRSKL